MPRTVTLVLVDADGRALGSLPPFGVGVPWWPEVWDVVAYARERYGIDVTVLRILSTEPGLSHGGAVTYLAQTSSAGALDLASPTESAGVDAEDHPLRARYARPGGPAASLRWAEQALERVGRGPLMAAEQRKTWNLSAIWRLDTPHGPVWLKEVPPFFGHEAAVLTWLAAGGMGNNKVVPLLAEDGTRMLLGHVAGDDLHDAGLATRLGIAADMHAIQRRASADTGTLLTVGVPDRRAARLASVVTEVVAAHGAGEPLRGLLDGLEARLATVAACGLPDTLVHGDLHPGNVRGDGERRMIIDWGDACIAHPAFDILRLAEGLDEAGTAELMSAWAALWRTAVPGCDPETTIELLRPVAALRNAAIYAHFLANIEPDEHRYHAADVGFWLDRAAALDRSARTFPALNVPLR